MAASSLVNRRLVLAAVTTCSLAGLARIVMHFARPAEDLPRPLLSHLLSLWSDPKSAKVIGRVYLAQRPKENESQTLLGLVLDELSRSEFEACDQTGARDEIKSCIVKDFAAGRTVSLDGWIVSLTEARVCALLALTS